jgi:phosphatidylserine decarboxylase
MYDEKILEQLNELVSKKANERYILAKLKHLKYNEIGEENIKKLIECFKAKDQNNNKSWRIKTTNVSISWFYNNYENFMDFFNRSITQEKFKEIKKEAKKHQIIIPNECNIESIGTLKDTSSIIRLKKDSKSVAKDLQELGVNSNYIFVNMKLLISYYHNIHSPVTGKIKKIIPIDKKLSLFGKNTLWFLEFETIKKPVYFLLVGESAIQDFNFYVKKNDEIEIGDKLGYFVWGSQTILLFDKDSYEEEIKIQKKHHYFLGQPIL